MSRIKPRFPWAYYALCVLLYILAFPLLVFSSFRQKHKESIPQRFFPWRIAPLAQSPKYWFHACSFGEVRSLAPLIAQLQKHEAQNLSPAQAPTILITTITQTGYHEAKKLFESTLAQNLDSENPIDSNNSAAATIMPAASSAITESITESTTESITESTTESASPQVIVRYLPFELFLPLWGSSLSQLQSLIVTEAEMWRMLFFMGKASGAKTLLINARISTRSLPSYRRFAWFYRRIFGDIDSVLAQSSLDKQRLESIGARHVKSFGNLKALSLPKLSARYPKPAPLVFTAASTHKGEEKLILEAYVEAFVKVASESRRDSEALETRPTAAISESSLDSKAPSLSPLASSSSLSSSFSLSPSLAPRPMLLLVPRHPERFEEVFTLAQDYAKTHALRMERFSNLCAKSPSAPLSANMPFDILLIDTLGALINLYALSDVVILGGSFVPVGGHNPLEVAHFGARLISGEHIFNQHALFELVKNYVLIPPYALTKTLLGYQKLLPTSLEVPTSELLEQIIAEIVQPISESSPDSRLDSEAHTDSEN